MRFDFFCVEKCNARSAQQFMPRHLLTGDDMQCSDVSDRCLLSGAYLRRVVTPLPGNDLAA